MERLSELLRDDNFRSMAADGCAKAAKGLTTFGEVIATMSL